MILTPPEAESGNGEPAGGGDRRHASLRSSVRVRVSDFRVRVRVSVSFRVRVIVTHVGIHYRPKQY